jgi:hypothetical protein
MRNPSPRSFSVRPRTAALLLGAALLVSETAAPAAHALPRTAPVVYGDAVGGLGQPAVGRRLVRPQRRLVFRASRSGLRPGAGLPPVGGPLIPLTDPVWERLRRCESGGRYDINTGNGFHGAYQFVPSTWRGLGYSGMPHQAPPGVQDEAAQRLQARSGWGQWPACSRRLGLR